MEIIILLVLVALGVAVYLGRKKPAEAGTVDTWQPPAELHVTTPINVPEAAATIPVPLVVEKAPAKKTVAKKAPAKKAPAAKKPAAKKPAAKKTTKTVKKPAAKK